MDIRVALGTISGCSLVRMLAGCLSSQNLGGWGAAGREPHMAGDTVRPTGQHSGQEAEAAGRRAPQLEPGDVGSEQTDD